MEQLYARFLGDFNTAQGDFRKQAKIKREYSDLAQPLIRKIYCNKNLDLFLVRVGENKWKTKHRIYLISPRNFGIVEDDFLTDLCSRVPDSDWWYACLVHDWLYQKADLIGKAELSVTLGRKKIKTELAFATGKAVFRRLADTDLMYLMRVVSHKWYAGIASVVYFHGVRVFGWLPFWKK